jgi:hypothetical protein
MHDNRAWTSRATTNCGRACGHRPLLGWPFGIQPCVTPATKRTDGSVNVWRPKAARACEHGLIASDPAPREWRARRARFVRAHGSIADWTRL